MFKQLFVSLFLLCFLSFNVSAKEANPFAKNDSVSIGKDAVWKIDKKAGQATKTGKSDGVFYHLQFDNKQLKLLMTSDAAGTTPKSFSQLEVKDIKIDGKRSSLFKWCLNNQERHNRFLQQGLSVKKGVCAVNGSSGEFVLRLNKDTLVSLQKGSSLMIFIKPFRTPVELNYDISDFKGMYQALNAKPAAAVAVAVPAGKSVAKSGATAQQKKKCRATAPAKYKSIKAVEYNCSDAAAKKSAEAKIAGLVNQEKVKEQKLAAEKEKQRVLAEQKKQQELEEKLRMEEQQRIEAAADAASEAKQAQINNQISMKMIAVCDKFWSKGEHRCYCQKYIDHAPASIKAGSTCE